MTKQSETDDSQQNGNISMNGQRDFQDSNENGMHRRKNLRSWKVIV